MNKRVLVLAAPLFSSSVHAQIVSPTAEGPLIPRELLPIWQKHAVLVTGATDPSGIPYGYAMERAFFTLAPSARGETGSFRQELAQFVPAAPGGR
jgi:hypothetical protein